MYFIKLPLHTFFFHFVYVKQSGNHYQHEQNQWSHVVCISKKIFFLFLEIISIYSKGIFYIVADDSVQAYDKVVCAVGETCLFFITHYLELSSIYYTPFSDVFLSCK